MKGPPDLGEQKRFEIFMTSIMAKTKNKLDAQQVRVGHQEFCKRTMEFMTANYKLDNRLMFIDGK